MKKILFIFSVSLLCICVSTSLAQIQNTAHDLSSGSGYAFNQATVQSTNVNRICVFCHTPHQPSGTTTDPLWNHTLSSAASYGVYASATMNAVPTEVVGSGGTSELCMSCHDGTVGVGSLYNTTAPAPDNAAVLILPANSVYLGTDLTNDHPVNFTYDTALATADGGLYDPAATPAVAALLVGGTVQCSSCHDPHDNTFGSFLVASNAASALCLTCHNK